MLVNICDGIDRLSDSAFEANYARILELAEDKLTTRVQIPKLVSRLE